MRKSFLRLLSFYGLAWQAGVVVKASNWSERNHNWFTQPTHNDLRVTRILTSLTVLGFGAEAEALLAALEQLRTGSDCGVSEETWGILGAGCRRVTTGLI